MLRRQPLAALLIFLSFLLWMLEGSDSFAILGTICAGLWLLEALYGEPDDA